MSEEEIKEEIIEEEPEELETPDEEEHLEEEPEPEPEKKEPEKWPEFELVGDFPEAPKPKPDETFEIVHLGQVHTVTKDKAIELMQKGYDYDSKVGPHGKMVQMIEADPEFANYVNEGWQRKVAGLPVAPAPEKPKVEDFRVRPIADYENETEWLQDNLRAVINTVQDIAKPAPAPEPIFKPVQPEQPAPAPAPMSNTVRDALQIRDPEHFHKVLPRLGEYINKLTVADYQKVDSDMGALCQFYDFVKKNVLNEAPPATPAPPTSKPTFKVRSGGGQPPKPTDVSPAWKLSKSDFQKELDKVKGY